MLHPSYARLASVMLPLAFVAGCDGETDPPTDAGGLDAGAVDAGEGTDARVVNDASIVDASASDGGHVAPLPSGGCSAVSTTYPAGTTTVGDVVHDTETRTFRVHVPPGEGGTTPLPLVVMLHGGGGSGRQFEEDSSRMNPIADREGFIAVYPDGTGALRTWNAGGCCGAAVGGDVDDVGFVEAMLDHLETELCVDRRRTFAAGMSNGGLMSHRLACELSERFAAVAPVAGTEMSPTCTPARRVAVMHVHGSADGHVPFEGGDGCGLSGVSFTSVPATMERRRALNGCDATRAELFVEGDTTCAGYPGCDDGADVVLCTVEGGGHNWPGGEPPAGIVACPGNGGQSTTFIASEVIWRFFRDHPMRP